MNRDTIAAAADHQSDTREGLLAGLAAYVLWGVLPIYFKLLANVPAVSIVAHRILWSIPFLWALMLLGGKGAEVRAALRRPRTMLLLATTAVLIAINWLLYVHAVTSGHILAGSLGYYLNPLANVLLGRFILKERLGGLQWTALAIAALGLSALMWEAAGQLWISLTLCFSFATYGLLRKVASVDSVAGLTIETGLLLPFAAAWLLLHMSGGSFGTGGSWETVLLLLSGVATMVPLLLFTAAARRLPYSTLGMLQFLAPTLQFLLAVLLYDERFTTAHALAFGGIWLALGLYVLGLARGARRPVPLD